MTTEVLPRPAACPACVVPTPDVRVADAVARGNIVLALPGIHCAACIVAVEKELNALPGVKSARVNFSLKRVVVDAAADVTPQALINATAGIGYEAHELDPSLLAEANVDQVGRNLLMRLAVAGFAMMNVMLLSVAVWSGAEAATRDLMHWISAMIALPTIAFSGQPFFTSAWSVLKVKRLNMDVPISLAILLAGGMSLYETMESGAHAYFDAALSLTFFLLAGRYLDYRTRASARSAAQELAALEVPRAVVLVDGQEIVTQVAELKLGDTVLVKPGTRIPVDGVILTGESEIDRAFLTGESLPVYAGPDAKVSAGEINLTGALSMRVTALSKDSALQKVAELVALAETSRNRYTSLADRAASIYAPGVHALAAITFVVWLVVSGDVRMSLNIAIATLIITCPCALGLAVPAVATAASGRLFRKGILLKSATALERLAEVDSVIFDKTGTLTLGQPSLSNVETYEEEVLSIAAALASHSAHPLAQALATAVPDAKANLSGIREIPGHGIEARMGDKVVRLGRASWLGAVEVGQTASYFKIEGQEPVAFTFVDDIRPGARELVESMQKQGLTVSMMTGDSEIAARETAARLGIKQVFAGALPAEKALEVQRLTEQGHKVLMVGDGLNDTGALAAAEVSISPASAIDAARVASDIVVLGKDFAVLNDCIHTARSAKRRILENFGVAALYNLISIPFAVLGFATPLLAALAMSTSSICVTLNAWRLR